MSLLTRYLMRLLLIRFALLLCGLTAFLIGLDLMANANAVIAHDDGGVRALVRYALLRSPTIVSDLIKIATLLAGLLTLTFLIRHGELTAIWNSGVSQFGLVGRLIPLAVVLGGLQFVVDDRLVPASVDALREWGGVNDTGRPGPQKADGITWIHLGDDIVRIPSDNIGVDSLSDFTLFDRDTRGRLIARLDVGSARYHDDGTWQLFDITTMNSAGGRAVHEDTRDWLVDLDTSSLKHLLVHPRELSLSQTHRFTGGQGQGTWAPYLYETWLYAKLAQCLVPLLMLSLSVVLAQQSQRAGRLGILLLGGVAIGFSFFIFNGITLAMGEVGLLPPLIASGAPLAVFAMVAASIAYWYELKQRPA
ncbi:LptF/LptG family permease [Pelagibius litoralis]|uniref:LptF/LptG family permease n=1 Tax=Pelagibius litoralis TaxID=374515 RepID=A0A967F1V3_9PROT|nr:LptF/LptG family permease [Pelagibius litoralis]NIA71494.1 LptF/LptG family permease [Pelagibius litoralis]